MYSIEQTSRIESGRFENHEAWKEPSIMENSSTICELFFKSNERKPTIDLPRKTVDLIYFTEKGWDRLNSTWLGHSTVMINVDGYKIITDPVFEQCVSIVGPKRFNGDLPMDINLLPEIDAVIISHNHYDHLNKFSIRFLENRTRTFIVPTGVKSELLNWGVPSGKIVELDWWDSTSPRKDITITATPSQHFSGRGLADRNKSLWSSYVVKGPDHSIFFSGDSGYFDGFKKIGEMFGPFDMTFLECGAYHEKWHHLHMFPEETVQAHIDLQGRVLHPIHWGTFNLALHSWYEPMNRLTAASEPAGVITATPIVGETSVYGGDLPVKKWWIDAMVGK